MPSRFNFYAGCAVAVLAALALSARGAEVSRLKVSAVAASTDYPRPRRGVAAKSRPSPPRRTIRVPDAASPRPASTEDQHNGDGDDATRTMPTTGTSSRTRSTTTKRSASAATRRAETSARATSPRR